jgi:hypothetical protein
MAGLVAAGDAHPPAAVLPPSSPRREDAFRVAGDVFLEGQQRVPLVRQAARVPLELPRRQSMRCHRQEARGGGHDKKQELGSGGMHSKWCGLCVQYLAMSKAIC